MLQLRMILAPRLKVLPRHVGSDNLVATTQRKSKAAFRQKGIKFGTRDLYSRVNQPSRNDFCDPSVSGQEDFVVSMRRF